jgi:hypothetical protein
MPIRSGRFEFENTQTAGPYTIVEVSSNKGSAAIYRLFNSGDVDFTLDVGNGPRTLSPATSIDVAIGEKVALQVNWAAPGTPKNVRLSYDFLADEAGAYLQSVGQLRSGRYAGTPGSSGAIIVDLGNAARAAYYRILNAGDSAVTIEAGGHGSGANPTPISIPAGFSKDVLVTNGTPGDKVLKITTTTEVDVIYDLLGGVE